MINDRKVENFSIPTPRNKSGSGDIRLWGAAILLLLVLLMTYVYIPNRMLELDYRMERTKQDIQRLQCVLDSLRLRESELTSLARLEERAQALGLRQPTLEQVEFVPSIDSWAPNQTQVALNAGGVDRERR